MHAVVDFTTSANDPCWDIYKVLATEGRIRVSQGTSFGEIQLKFSAWTWYAMFMYALYEFFAIPGITCN